MLGSFTRLAHGFHSCSELRTLEAEGGAWPWRPRCAKISAFSGRVDAASMAGIIVKSIEYRQLHVSPTLDCIFT